MGYNKNLWNSIQVKKPQKSTFDLTHDVKMSCNMGELVPIMNTEVLPGDHFTISNQNLIRFAPMLAPVMHRIDVHTHYFFVPNRIVWSNWEKFITNDVDAHAHPYVRYGETGTTGFTAAQIRLFNFFGLPTPVSGTYVSHQINPFPLIAYNRIWNDYYRDQNLQPVKLLDTLTDGDNTGTLNSDVITMQYRAWEHDYFTSSLPFAQKGAAVNIPLGNVNAPVYRQGLSNTVLTGSPASAYVPLTAVQPTVASDLIAIGSVGNTTINDLRRAYSLQKWLEKNARAGTRYVESLLAHFYVKAQDSRLQRAEYICGSSSPVMVSEVLNNTGTTGQLPQGNMAGHGISMTSGNIGHYTAQEHGWIIGIMSVVPKPAYQQGIPKNFIKTDFLDYAFPEFAQIGEQAVKNKEIYAYGTGATDPDGTFGYVPRYSEYKYQANKVAGDFMTTLNYWHLGRHFATQPALNSDFIKVKPDATTRIFAVTDPSVDHLYCQVVNNVKVVRALPFYGTPAW